MLLAILLGLFLWFNRIPKLDTVQGDLDSVTGAVAECFQGFCVEGDPDASLLDRWWDFSLTYLKLIALGMTFAFLVAGLTEVLLFPSGSDRGLFQRGLKGSAKGLIVGPAMNLCSACIVPVANAFRKRGAGIETTLAITQGSSTLNLPALIMAAMVFTPMLAGSRIGLSIVGALLLGQLVAKLAGQRQPISPISPAEQHQPVAGCASWREVVRVGGQDWNRASLKYLIKLGPLMVVAGFASAFVIQWVSADTVSTFLGDNPQGVAVAATLGLLINVPLLFEIPLVAGLLLVGMGIAPAATLLFAAEAGAAILGSVDKSSIPALGGGVVVLDYDGDGDQDIYVTDNDEAVLLSNNGNGETFTEVGAAFTIETRDISNQSRVTWVPYFSTMTMTGTRTFTSPAAIWMKGPSTSRRMSQTFSCAMRATAHSATSLQSAAQRIGGMPSG